jgi:hypothetical protein
LEKSAVLGMGKNKKRNKPKVAVLGTTIVIKGRIGKKERIGGKVRISHARLNLSSLYCNVIVYLLVELVSVLWAR